jgi:hypothetical protein
LTREGVIGQEAAALVREQLAAGGAPDEILRGVEGLSEEKLLRSLAEYFHLAYADLENTPAPPKELLARFPARLLLQHGLMPLEDAGDSIVVATSKLFDSAGLDELRLATGIDVRPALAPAKEIDRFSKKFLGVGADTLQ